MNPLARHSHGFELIDCRCPPVEQPVTGPGFSRKPGRDSIGSHPRGFEPSADIFSNFVPSSADRWADCRNQIARIDSKFVLQRAHSDTWDARREPAPARMGSRYCPPTRVGKQERNAVGGLDCQSQGRIVRHDHVSVPQLRCIMAAARSLDDDSRSVNLPQAG
jgi:hypothetical protein